MAVPSFVTKSRRYADGGAMPMHGAPADGPPAGPEACAPPQGGGQDPGAQLQAAATQYAQTKDPQLAVQIADMVVQIMGIPSGGAGAPSDGDADNAGGGAPMGSGAPMGGPPQMNKKGGKMPSFGKKAQGAGKPAFAVPGPGAGAKSEPKPNPFAAKAQGEGMSAKPMSADQKIKAKMAAKKVAGFGKK